MPAYRRLTPAGTLQARRGLPAAVLIRGVLTFAFFSVDAYVPLLLIGWRGIDATGRDRPDAATLTWTAGSWVQARYIVRLGAGRLRRRRLRARPRRRSASSPWSSRRRCRSSWPRSPGRSPGRHGPRLRAAVADRPGRGAAREPGAATAALQLSDVLGTALGTGTGGPLIAFAAGAGRPGWVGLAGAFAVGALVGCLGLVLTGRLRARADRPFRVALEARLDCNGRQRGPCCERASTLTGGPKPNVRRGAPSQDSRDSRLPQAGHPVLRHHDPAQGPRRLPGVDRPDARALARRQGRPRRRHGIARLHLQRADGLPPRMPASSRCASWASCRPRRSPSSTPSSTARTRSRSTATRSSPASGSWSSTTCWRRAARCAGTIDLVERLQGEVVGLGFLVELEFLKGRDRLQGLRVESVVRY